MSAFVTVVLKGTLGFLVKKGRQRAAKKLKDGDVTDQELRSWIVDEIDNVNSKLDAIARSDLGASISFFKEGLVFLNKVKYKKIDEVSTQPPVSYFKKRTWLNKATTKSGDSSVRKMFSLSEDLEVLNATSLDEEALADAKKRFDDARREATKAFNSEALSPSDRILAMSVRLMATILEKVENPASAVAACRSGLEELHLMPFVRENFNVEITKGVKSKFKSADRRQVVSSVCQLNRVIYDVALMVGEKEGLFLWPCIEIESEKVDPLRDSRVAETLRELEMGDCSVTWSFGQEGEEKHKQLNSATSIATNTLGQFLVVDDHDECVKVFDSTGKFLHSFGLPTEDKDVPGKEKNISAVATDRDDKIYVMVNERGMMRSASTAHIYVFNKKGDFCHKLLVEAKFRACTLKLKDNNLLVPGVFTTDDSFTFSTFTRYVVVSKTDGTRIGHFSEKTMHGIQDITAVADGRIMVLDRNSCVYVFADITADTGADDDNDDDDDDQPFCNRSVTRVLRKFAVAPKACAIAFHWLTGYVIIASQTPKGRSQVLLYSKEDKLESSIDLQLEEDEEITAATVTTDGRICLTTINYSDSWRDTKGKVLVL